MNIYFITPFPELVETLVKNNISNQGIKKNLVNVDVINLRDFSNNEYKQIDDEPYGGGSGMIMMCEPLFKAIEHCIDKSVSYTHLTLPTKA